MSGSAAVILDVDGTLVDSNDAHARAWVEAFAEHGITVAFEHVRRSIGMGGDKLMPEVSGIEEASSLGKEIAASRGRIFQEHHLPSIRPFPRTRELVERFADDGFVLAVASSAKADELDPLLERAGVSDLLALRTSSDDADNSKPDPDIVIAALKRTGCPADRTIMIGDTAYDVAAARRAGVEIVGLECGGWTREGLAGALAIYKDATDLLEHYQTSAFARVRA
ncbi:MAG: HAD family hydrolase [Acidobacteria bacterium]|nr:HAD family hydrolase [Acidobacteriota bacterium]